MENDSCVFKKISLALSHKSACSAGSQWPVGTYGVARAQAGCPSATGFQWRVGWRYQDTEDAFPNNRKSPNFHLDASVSSSDLKRHFCTKTNTTTDTARPPWPAGQYCIYKKGSCPVGLTAGYVHWDDDDWFNKNKKGGTIPDGVYDKNTKIYYCCRTDGNKTAPIPLPTDKPFFLLAYGSAECQQVEWALASSEWIRFDTEDTGNKDGMGGVHPYGAGMDDHTIHYCYYQSCNKTLNASRGTFASPNFPNKYPDGQLCSWRITVASGHQVSLTFTHFQLQSGTNADYVQVYDGKNETARILGSFSGLRSPTDKINSTSRDMFVVFRSDIRMGNTGFQASYTAYIPTASPSTQKMMITELQTTSRDSSSTGRPATWTPSAITTAENVVTSSTQTAEHNTSIGPATDQHQSNEGGTTSGETEIKRASTTTESEAEPTSLLTRPTKNTTDMYAMRVGEKSRDEDAVGLMVPIVCLLATFTVGLLLAFLYVRKRRIQRREKDGLCVTYKRCGLSSDKAGTTPANKAETTEVTSIENPLYDSDVSFPNRLYHSTTTPYVTDNALPVFIVQQTRSASERNNPLRDTTVACDARLIPTNDSTA